MDIVSAPDLIILMFQAIADQLPLAAIPVAPVLSSLEVQ